MEKHTLKELYYNPEFPLHNKQKEIFKRLIEWEVQPPIAKTGRSTFLLIENDEVPFKAVKIKGCGFFDLQSNQVLPPLSKEDYDAHLQDSPDGLKEIHYQIEVDNKGAITIAPPPLRPFGGQNFVRAKLEYDAHLHLYNEIENKENYPFYYPLGYGEYKDLKNKGTELGVTMLGMPVEMETPLAGFFDAKIEEQGFRINDQLIQYWKTHHSVVGQESPLIDDILKTLGELVFEFGKSLGVLNKYLVDFDSHFFNATVDFETGAVILYDLDHVLKVHEIPKEQYFYLCMKDFALGFVAVISNILLSGWVDVVDKTGIKLENIVKKYAEGYFSSLPRDQFKIDFTDKIWEEAVSLVENKLISTPFFERIHPVHEFCEQKRDRLYFDIFPSLLNYCKQNKKDIELTEDDNNKTIAAFFKSREETAKSVTQSQS